MSGTNANYVDYMYECWQSDPKTVNASWNAYFATGNFDTAPTLGQTPRDAQLDQILSLLKGGASGGQLNTAEAAARATDSVNLYRICRAY